MNATPEPGRNWVSGANEVEARLMELGLTQAMLHRSIEVGDTKRRLVRHPYYPATYPGVVMWAETIAALRRQLLRLRTGWANGSTSNFATVYSPELGIAIAVAAGDAGVGRVAYAPRPTRKKGKKTRERVERNARQILVQGELDLGLPPSPDPGREVAPDEECQTWFLLLHATKSEIRVELSCPLRMDEDGIVYGWEERIILDPVKVAGAIAPKEPVEDDDGDDEPLVSR